MIETVIDLDRSVSTSGETTPIDERLVVAPCSGRFVTSEDEPSGPRGVWVEPGETLGRVDAGGSIVPVTSAWRGWLMGALAMPGQPVRRGDALFWVRSR